MCGHVGKRQCGGRLHKDSRAPQGRSVGVTSEIRAKAHGPNKIPDGVAGIFRVGKVEGARHRLKSEGVVVHIYWCEGNGVLAVFHNPHGGRLDGIQYP
jgi:hypothetical protein